MSTPRQSGWPALQRRAELLPHQNHPASQVALHESYVELLTTVHAAAAPPLDWNQIAISPAPAPPTYLPRREHAARQVADTYQVATSPPPPPPPVYLPRREHAARQAADGYQPTLSERLFGGEQVKRTEFAQIIQSAQAADVHDYHMAVEAHRAVCTAWAKRQELKKAIEDARAADAFDYQRRSKPIARPQRRGNGTCGSPSGMTAREVGAYQAPSTNQALRGTAGPRRIGHPRRTATQRYRVPRDSAGYWRRS